MTRPLVIAIDGPAGSGKSTLGRELARVLGLRYVDTGAMYRAVALAVLAESDPEQAVGRAGELARRAGIELLWEPEGRGFGILLDGRDVTREVRGAEAARMASRVAAIPEVRAELVRRQRAIGAEGGVVMEGRDIGTVVLPDADFKFFVEAALEVRGQRREAEEGRNLDVVVEDIRERDRIDRGRELAPLVPAPDAVRVDTSSLDAAAVLRRVLELVAKGPLPGAR